MHQVVVDMKLMQAMGRIVPLTLLAAIEPGANGTRCADIEARRQVAVRQRREVVAA